MSGYRNSGLTQEQYEDRQALLDAASVIEMRWPYRRATVELVRLLARKIEEECGGI